MNVQVFLTTVAIHELLNYVHCDLELGDSCTDSRTKISGLCKLSADCPSAIADIRERDQYPTVCGYNTFEQIICCPREKSATSNPALISRISVQKCKEYTEYTSEVISRINFVTGGIIKTKIHKCTFDAIPLITGGSKAKSKEFPHMALIGYILGSSDVRWGCAGSLISDQFILTAAHCCTSRDFGRATLVRLGELNKYSEQSDYIDVTIAERIPHPEYSIKSQYNDIALLKLSRKIPLNLNIRPACLSTSFDMGNIRAIATGRGAVEWNGADSDELLKVTLDIFNTTFCKYILDKSRTSRLHFGIDGETQICAGSYNKQRDTCQGDSGGPLQIYHESEDCMYTLIGITSFGIVCGQPGIPGVYTRIHAYLDWIEHVIW